MRNDRIVGDQGHHRRAGYVSAVIACTLTVTTAFGQTTQPTADAATASQNHLGVTTASVYQPLAHASSKGSTTAPAPLRVAPIPADLRRDFEIREFYQKGVVVRGIPIIGSEKVSHYAILECAYQLDHMLADSPDWVLSALTDAKVRMGVMSVVEYTMDLPENWLWGTVTPEEAARRDRRARGMGGLPLSSCAEENLLNLPSDPYRVENITLHEFAHTLASAVQRVRPEWYERLKQAYARARDAGRFKGSYAMTNEQEYWAEGSQSWFDCNSPANDGRIHNGIWRRDQITSYDPDLARLLAEIYGNGAWRYVRTDERAVGAEGLASPTPRLKHLSGLDRDAFPKFDFENSPRIQALGAGRRPATQKARSN